MNKVLCYKKTEDNWPWLNYLHKIIPGTEILITDKTQRGFVENVMIFATRKSDLLFLSSQDLSVVYYMPHSFPFKGRSKNYMALLSRIVKNPKCLMPELSSLIVKRSSVKNVIVLSPEIYCKDIIKRDLNSILSYDNIKFRDIQIPDNYAYSINKSIVNSLLIIDQPLCQDGSTDKRNLFKYLTKIIDFSRANEAIIYLYKHPRSDNKISEILNELNVSFIEADELFQPKFCFTFSSTLSLFFYKKAVLLIPPNFSAESRELYDAIGGVWVD
jgi:hypothetical protein